MTYYSLFAFRVEALHYKTVLNFPAHTRKFFHIPWATDFVVLMSKVVNDSSLKTV